MINLFTMPKIKALWHLAQKLVMSRARFFRWKQFLKLQLRRKWVLEMDISGPLLPQNAIPSGHAKFQIHCVKEHQVTDVLLLSFHRKFRALVITRARNFPWIFRDSTSVTWISFELGVWNHACAFGASHFDEFWTESALWNTILFLNLPFKTAFTENSREIPASGDAQSPEFPVKAPWKHPSIQPQLPSKDVFIGYSTCP